MNPAECGSQFGSGVGASGCSCVIRSGSPSGWPSRLCWTGNGTRVAPGRTMILFFLLCVWAVALIAICAVCAAGGPDEERDSWYTDFQRQKDANRRERDAA